MNKMNSNICRNKMQTLTLTACVVCFMLFIFQGVGMAWGASIAEDKNFAWPSFDRSEPLKKEFVAVKHYNFAVRNFSPPVVVEQLAEPIGNDKLLYPEQTVRNHISAMRAGDYEWWLSTMDKTARETMQAADIEKNFAEKRKTQWQGIFKGTNVTMERWIETGRYLIITVRLQSSKNPNLANGGIEIPIVMSVQEGAWLVTANLKTDDPVFQYFNHPDLTEKDSVVIERIIK